MGRLLLFLVIGSVLALAHPDAREWLKPHTEFALNPVFRWSANSEVSAIARRLEEEQAQGRVLPTSRNFTQFLERELRYAEGTDPWGTPYYLKAERFGVRVGSAGPDRVVGTEDDILSPPIAVSVLP